MSTSTPKNLFQAIENGLQGSPYVKDSSAYRREAIAEQIAPHVIDFLNQRFASAILMAVDTPIFEKMLIELHASITGVGK